MIEVVYTPKDNARCNDVIRLPRNIKQIGDIKDSRKIYIEDYAINYLEELSKTDRVSKTGVLIGTAQKSGSDRYLFIKGAIWAKDVFISESVIDYGQKDWTYIYDECGKYFPGLDIVGWFYIGDNVNVTMNQTLRKTFSSQFAGAEKAMFVIERVDNLKYFSVFENNRLSKQKGYTIYYERNEQMQEYIVNNREQEKEIPKENEEITENIKDENPKAIGKRQAIVNYCANVAMIVLILFIGMYIMDSRINPKEEGQADILSQDTLTPVVVVGGDVYPTNEITIPENTQATTIDTTNTDIAKVIEETTTVEEASTVEETSTAQETGTYITVSNTVASEAQAKPEYTTHIVSKGENLYTISKKYYGTISRVDEIMEINNIEDMDKIYEGQKIKLP